MAAGSPGGKEVGRLALKVLPDTSTFPDELKAFAERIEEQVKIELKVELDSASAQAELERLQAQMEAAELSLDIGTELDGAGAMAHMEVLLGELQTQANLNPIDIETDFDMGQAAVQMAAMNTALQTASSGSSSVGRRLALWGPLVFLALTGIVAFGPALLTVFPLIAGLALGLGAVISGWKELKKTLQPVVDTWKDMRKEIGQVLTIGLDPLIHRFINRFMPILKEGLVLFAQVFNTGAQSLLRFLSSSKGVELLTQAFVGVAHAFSPFASLLGPLTEMFLRLIIMATPGLEYMALALLDIVRTFNTWLGAADRSDTVITSLDQIGEILSIIGSLAKASFPALMAAIEPTLALLRGVGAALGMLFSVLTPVFEFLSNHLSVMETFGVILTVVLAGLIAVTAATAAWGFVMSTNPIALVVIAIAALVAGMIYAYNNFESFRNVVDTVWGVIKQVGEALSGMGPVLKIVGVGLGILVGVLTAVRAAMIAVNIVMAINPFVLIVAAIVAVVAALIYAYTHFEGFRNVVDSVFAFLKPVVLALLGPFMNFVKAILKIGEAFGHLKDGEWGAFFKDLGSGILMGLKAITIDILLAPFKAFWEAIKGFFGVHSPSTLFASLGMNLLQGLLQGLIAAGTLVLGWVTSYATMLVRLWTLPFRLLLPLIMVIFNGILAYFRAVFAIILAVVRTWIAGVRAVIAGIAVVGTFIRNAFNAGKNAVTTAITGILSAVGGLPDKVLDKIGDLKTLLVGVGEDMMRGFLTGIGNMAKDVADKAISVAKGAKDKLKGFLGIHSPSRVFAEIGQFTIQGFINGLESQYSDVISSVGGFASDFTDAASFAAIGTLDASAVTSPMIRALDGALSAGSESTGAHRFIIDDWRTGMGHFEDIADSKVSALRSSTATANRMGVPA